MGIVLVVGFGNTLAGDDGAGPAVIERLRSLGVPAGARAEDGGSDSLGLSALHDGEREIWLVDALVRGAPPGTISRLGHDEVLSVPQRHGTVHRMSLPDSLRLLAITDPSMAVVRYRLWGIEPASMRMGDTLSGAVDAAAWRAAEEIMRELDAAVSLGR